MRPVNFILAWSLILAPCLSAAAQDCGGTPEQEAAEFKAIDTDSDGKISTAELKKIAPNLEEDDATALTSGQGLDFHRFSVVNYKELTNSNAKLDR